MLPSNGFFKDHFCPYDKAKLCHRPYCHYKHAVADNLEKIGDEVEETEYLFDTSHVSNLWHHSKPLYSVDNEANASYVPTPVGKCVKPGGILKSNNSNINQPSTSFIPEYNPTPISKLKELNNSHSHFNDYAPQYSVPLRKKKKIEEYDPTEVKCVTKKNVTFADPSELSLQSDCLPTFSSSEDETDPAVAPTFSDDDAEDMRNNLPPPKPITVDVKKDNSEEELDEKKIDEFSLVDKILVDCKKNEKFLTINSKPLQSISRTAPQKTKSKKKPAPEVKKDTIDNSDIYDCDLGSSASASSDSKKSKPKVVNNISNSTKSSSLKNADQSKSKSGATSKDEKDNKSKAKDSVTSKSKEKSSKDSKGDKIKRTDDKTKHGKSSSNSQKSSSSSNSEKTKSSVPSHSEKSSSSSKISKSGKSETSDGKLSKSKEAKLQDEKVSSSSISKKNKLEQASKLSNSSESYSKSKSKSNSKEDVSKHTSKLKKESSVSKPNIEKHGSMDKSSQSASASTKLGIEDEDSSVGDVSDEVISLSSDCDTDDECKRIFEETFPDSESQPSISDKEMPSHVGKAQVRDVTAAQKKRQAHAAAAEFKKPMSNARKIAMKQLMNPEQVMYNRYAKVRALQAEQVEQKNALAPKRLSNSPARGPEKKRICFTPNQNLLAAIEERKKSLSATPSNDFSPLPSTVSKSLKVTKRVAHVPDVVAKARPVIPIDYGSKVPTVVRQKYLNAFIDEYLKFSSTEDEAYDSALEEEKKAYQRSSSKAIYMNVASNALNRLRHRPQAEAGKKNDSVTSTTKTVSHEVLLNGPLAQRTSFSIVKKKPAPVFELKGTALYEHLMEYLLTEEQLKDNGFPMPHPTELGRAVIQGMYANKTNFCNDRFKRVCCRCQKTYYVNVDGDYVRDEECDFHWGRLWKKKIAGAFESRYSCCQGDSESDGCCVSLGHVFEGSESHALKGFVSTLAKTPPPDNYHGIYALDCEMCYTTAGIELTRVSVTGPDHKSVYETFVKPQNKVLDYNTRFSGITEENLINEKTTIRDVQAVLLCMFNSRTILIGHSLESDLKALKLFHKTVVDTSVVFPHKLGPPYKRALRTLMAEKLNKIIQNDVGGHDSCEDAVSCMELMIWKIKEDLKGNR